MEVTALCIRLLMNVLMVLVAQVQNSYCAQKNDGFPRIVPNRLQFVEYESISVHCEFYDSAEWRVKRTLQETILTNTSNWVTSAGSGTIDPAFSSDSGEYWCEDGDGLRSNSVNVTVTAGFVILVGPVLPVKEGDNVTLQCNTKSSTDSIADFYKDGVRVWIGYEGNMTIFNFSTSHEGLYKCNIAGAGESPESRLTVRGQRGGEDAIKTSGTIGPREETKESPFPDFLTTLSVVVTFLLLALLLLVVGVVRCRRHKDAADKPEGNTPGETRSDDVADPCNATYAVVKKPRKKKVTGSVDQVDPQEVTYASVSMKKKDPNASKARTKPRLPEENVVYASVNVSGDKTESDAPPVSSNIPLRAETPD